MVSKTVNVVSGDSTRLCGQLRLKVLRHLSLPKIDAGEELLHRISNDSEETDARGVEDASLEASCSLCAIEAEALMVVGHRSTFAMMKKEMMKIQMVK